MNNTTQKRSIATASIGALLIAAALLVSVVLPAEYGWDPLGTGKVLGLMRMSEGASPALKTHDSAWHEDSIRFELAPFEAVEYKYRLEAGDAMLYQWQSDGEVLFEMHAEPDGAAPGYAESFAKSRGNTAAGNYTAPFSGIHGWFWQNRTQQTVTITLTSSGFFSKAIEFKDGREFEHPF